MGSGTITIYTDAARDDRIAGIGYTIQSDDISIEGQKFMEGNYTSMEAEFHALIEAVRVASVESSSDTMCEVYTDCQPLIVKMETADEDRVDWQEYRESYLWLADKFESCELVHTSRNHNERAHNLARDALENGRRKNSHNWG